MEGSKNGIKETKNQSEGQDLQEELETVNESKRMRLDKDVPLPIDIDTDDSGLNSDDPDFEDMEQGDMNESPTIYAASDNRSLAEKSFGPPVKYFVNNAETTYRKMLASINECRKVIDHTPTTIRILLNYRNWDKENLYELYYCDSDLSKFFKAAGLMDPNIQLPVVQALPSECEICCSDLPIEDKFTSGCGHSFCNACWKNYLLTKVLDNVVEEKIECPAHLCKFLLEDDIVMLKLGVSDAQDKYKKLITGSYVQSNRLMKWCPGAGCPGNVIELEQGPAEWLPVTCSCSHCFCFKCSNTWHGPVKCIWIKKWNKKCSDDSETVNWISVNTKACPKCEAAIEKNGGCNHMTCTNTACKYQFCWICLGDWDAHGGQNYRCNRYEDNVAPVSTNVELSEQSLRRYLFYFDRYFSHHKSLKSESELKQKMDKKVKALMGNGCSFHDLTFLTRGVQILCQSRQTLMYTYVFAYYLTRTNEANIFEDNQSDLQRATEELSFLLESDVIGEPGCKALGPKREPDSKPINDALKQIITNKTNYCATRCRVLLKHVYEGYEEENYWKYIESET